MCCSFVGAPTRFTTGLVERHSSYLPSADALHTFEKEGCVDAGVANLRCGAIKNRRRCIFIWGWADVHVHPLIRGRHESYILEGLDSWRLRQRFTSSILHINLASIGWSINKQHVRLQWLFCWCTSTLFTTTLYVEMNVSPRRGPVFSLHCNDTWICNNLTKIINMCQIGVRDNTYPRLQVVYIWSMIVLQSRGGRRDAVSPHYISFIGMILVFVHNHERMRKGWALTTLRGSWL